MPADPLIYWHCFKPNLGSKLDVCCRIVLAENVLRLESLASFATLLAPLRRGQTRMPPIILGLWQVAGVGRRVVAGKAVAALPWAGANYNGPLCHVWRGHAVRHKGSESSKTAVSCPLLCLINITWPIPCWLRKFLCAAAQDRAGA